MPEAVNQTPSGRRWQSWAMRLIGVALLVVLLAKLDVKRMAEIFAAADGSLIVMSALGIIPLIFVKTVRWQIVLRAQQGYYGLWDAFLAYFGSLFVGYLTPGRLGEFVKAVHVSRDCGMSSARAFSTVLADRLFDLYALLLVGSAAVFTLAIGSVNPVSVVGLTALLIVPLLLYLNGATYDWLRTQGLKFGKVGRKVFAEDGWVAEIRAGLLSLSFGQFVVCSALTLFAYGIFFGQCYLLALALKLPAGFVSTTFAVSLGSLITLLPISISGLGTREAATIAYLTSVGVTAEAALSFSLLVFVAFYIAGGLIGAAAWLLKPLPLKLVRSARDG